MAPEVPESPCCLQEAGWLPGEMVLLLPIMKKGGHRAGGIAGSRAELLSNIPWLSRLPKHHHLQSCTELISPLHGESPGTGFHTMGFSIAKKTLNDTDLRVLASPLLMEHASAFTSN